MRIVIAGGSGQVGHILARHFVAKGDSVAVLSRRPQAVSWRVVLWDGLNRSDWVSELEQSDVCINLSGRSVDCRYTKRNRREILDSRVTSTLLLGDVIGSLKHPPKVWLNATTATIYRHSLDLDMDEATGELGGNEPGAPDSWKFSIEVAKRWEKAFFSSRPTPGTRLVALRSAMTMSPDRGGVFDVLLGLVRHELGGAQGLGDQYMSWIHEQDFVRAVDWIIDHEEFAGVVNLASPHPIPNREFMATLRAAWGTRIGLPALPWMIEIGAFFLRTESELVLKSRRVVPGRLMESGFVFDFPHWAEAARDLVKQWREKSA
jgi:uncharacterized protein (TIGR01777 family)